MALTTRYFSTAAAGVGDGTTWADRAELLPSGNWASVITGFDFSANAMEARIGPGNYTCSQVLDTTTITTDPTTANPLVMHGCDSSGNLLSPPDRDWTSDQPAWSDATLPVIATTTNINTISLANCFLRLLKFSASGCNGAVLNLMSGIEWLHVINTTSNSGSIAVARLYVITNSVLSCTGSSYSSIIWSDQNVGYLFNNLRVTGVTGSSGTRHGIIINAFSPTASITRTLIASVGGVGFHMTGAAAPDLLSRCTIINCGSDGVRIVRSAAGLREVVVHCYIANCGGYGINMSSSTGLFSLHNRFRDNTSGSLTGLGNLPEYDSYTTDSDDATEFVDAGTGDYRIKSGSVIHGNGYGVSDQASSGGGGGPLIGPGRLIRG